MAFCTKCGTQIGDGVNFCPSCGKALSAMTTGTILSIDNEQQPRQESQKESTPGYIASTLINKEIGKFKIIDLLLVIFSGIGVLMLFAPFINQFMTTTSALSHTSVVNTYLVRYISTVNIIALINSTTMIENIPYGGTDTHDIIVTSSYIFGITIVISITALFIISFQKKVPTKIKLVIAILILLIVLLLSLLYPMLFGLLYPVFEYKLGVGFYFLTISLIGYITLAAIAIKRKVQ